MKSIEQLLRETDRGRHSVESDPAVLAGKVLRTIRRRRLSQSMLAVALLAGAVGLTLMTIPRFAPSPIVATHITPQSQPSEDSSEAIRSEIAIREALITRLEVIERRSQASARLISLPLAPREDQLIEQAAAIVIKQADRLLDASDDPQ